MTEHDFSIYDVVKSNPVFKCANPGCYIVWWPDRNKPKSKCKDRRHDRS